MCKSHKYLTVIQTFPRPAGPAHLVQICFCIHPGQSPVDRTTCTIPINRVGQNHIYIRFIYGIFGREITKYTVIYVIYIRFWPALLAPLSYTLIPLSRIHSSSTQNAQTTLHLSCTLTPLSYTYPALKKLTLQSQGSHRQQTAQLCSLVLSRLCA